MELKGKPSFLILRQNYALNTERTKLTSHRYQAYGYVLVTTVVEPVFTCCHGFFIFSTRESVSASETATNLSSLDDDIFQTTIDSWAEVTSCGTRAD